MRPKFQRFAMFNCQGLKDEVKQTHIADNFYKLHLAAIMVQETCIKETSLHEFTSSNRKKVCLYNWGSGAKLIQGVRIITTENINVTFNPVLECICIITTNTEHKVPPYKRLCTNIIEHSEKSRWNKHQSLNINLVTKQHGFHHPHRPFHVKIHIEIK